MALIRTNTQEKKLTKSVTTGSCMKNVNDCRYRSNNGCSAEWCIYEELPKIVNENKTISCEICGVEKTVSIYSGETSYICDDCKKQIKKILTESKCSLCGASTNVGEALCSNCKNKIWGKLNEQD